MYRKKKFLVIVGSILVVAIIVVHIPKYNTALWIGSDVDDLSTLFDRDCRDNMDTTHFDLKVEIGGNIVYQTDSVDFNRYVYTRKDIPLRAGFHKIIITSESMNIRAEKLCYTLFNYYVVLEFYSPAAGENNDRVYVWTGFMPVRFI